jgi:tetratricopeptide (TPR) repeat protein
VTASSVLTLRQTDIWKDSITLWKFQIKEYSKAPSSYLALANSYMDKMDFENAEHYYEKTFNMAEQTGYTYYKSESLYLLGFLHLMLEAQEKADYVIRQFEKEYPKHPKLWLLKGYAQYLRGAPETALRMYQKVPLGTNIMGKFELTTLYTLKGDVYRDLGIAENALISYQKALRLISSYPAAYHGMARAYLMKGDRHAAERYLNIVLKIDPNNFKALADMAYLILLQGKDPNTALPYAERSVSFHHPFHHPYLIMGTVLTASGFDGRSEAYYRKAAELGAPEYLVYFNRSWGFTFIGDHEKQRYYLRKILTLKGVPRHISQTAEKIVSGSR